MSKSQPPLSSLNASLYKITSYTIFIALNSDSPEFARGTYGFAMAHLVKTFELKFCTCAIVCSGGEQHALADHDIRYRVVKSLVLISLTMILGE